MKNKIYGAAFYALALGAAVYLYPQHPVLCGLAIGLFVLAFMLQVTALLLRRPKKVGEQ